MNGSYFLIVETLLLTPLPMWVVANMAREEDRLLSIHASLITLAIQSIPCFLFRKHIVAEPVIFFMAYMICQALVIFQINTVRRLRSHVPFLRTQPLAISVVINSLAHTVPLWFLAGCMFVRFSEMQ